MSKFTKEHVKVGSIWVDKGERKNRMIIEAVGEFLIHYRWLDHSMGYWQQKKSSVDADVFIYLYEPVYTIEGFEV